VERDGDFLALAPSLQNVSQLNGHFNTTDVGALTATTARIQVVLAPQGNWLHGVKPVFLVLLVQQWVSSEGIDFPVTSHCELQHNIANKVLNGVKYSSLDVIVLQIAVELQPSRPGPLLQHRRWLQWLPGSLVMQRGPRAVVGHDPQVLARECWVGGRAHAER